MQTSVIGQSEVVEKIIISLLVNGNLLLEGLPGTAKTRAIKTLAGLLSAQLGRVQFTPDLLPSDITGTDVYHVEGDNEKLVFQPGPVFANLVLADEVNRAPAKVQAALLEAMEERQVTVAGNTYKLPELFMVLATQNPIEQEGTYPLPEAQMDRFVMKIATGYPDEASELAVIRLVRGEEIAQSPDLEVIQQAHIFAAREQINQLHTSANIEQYIVSLVMATRHPERYSADLSRWIETGASPRGSIALDKCSRAHAWLQGREYTDPDDVRAVMHACLRHRLVLDYEALADGITPDHVLDEIQRLVAVA